MQRLGLFALGFRIHQDISGQSLSTVSDLVENRFTYRTAADSKLKYRRVASVKIPTWTTPLFISFVVAVLLSNTSFLGHICAIGIGYLRKRSSYISKIGSMLTKVRLKQLAWDISRSSCHQRRSSATSKVN
jgi:hypothetical protein